MMEQEEED
jgi:hypothetical protein